MRKVVLSELTDLDAFLGRGHRSESAAHVEARVREIVERVRRGGDQALQELTQELDEIFVPAESLRITSEELEAAAAKCEAPVRESLGAAARAIYRFHRPQRVRSYRVNAGANSSLAQVVRPLARVGLYVPGGRASYPSSVLMNAIPARVAGVPEIAVVTPPGAELHPAVAAALLEVELREVYRVGGAQAIAALAWGTETIPAVDKIVGPGNAYVAEAKRQLFGRVDIDSVAGPSEVVVVADQTARPEWIAAELLAQAEHDPDACVVAIVTEHAQADAVLGAVANQTENARRREVIEQSIAARGGVVVAPDVDEAVALSNRIAPEHLVLMVKKPSRVMRNVTAAGCVFLGPHSPVALGDYAAGPNHVLPTGGAARHSSALSAYDFVKRLNVVDFTEADLRRRADTIVTLARVEGLDAHADSVELRTRESS